jgi:hypothetical protein
MLFHELTENHSAVVIPLLRSPFIIGELLKVLEVLLNHWFVHKRDIRESLKKSHAFLSQPKSLAIRHSVDQVSPVECCVVIHSELLKLCNSLGTLSDLLVGRLQSQSSIINLSELFRESLDEVIDECLFGIHYR